MSYEVDIWVHWMPSSYYEFQSFIDVFEQHTIQVSIDFKDDQY